MLRGGSKFKHYAFKPQAAAGGAHQGSQSRSSSLAGSETLS
jgi:hypothetical protein